MPEVQYFQRLSASVERIMIKFGIKDVYQLLRNDPDAPQEFIDPLFPSKGYKNTLAKYPVWSAFSNYKAYQIDGALIQAIDKPVYISIDGLSGVIPEESDQFAHIASGEVFEIMSVKTYQVSGNNLVHLLQVRGA